ncbi:hypothetical protein ACFCXA_28495 [Streptomyces virginiae]|uniref:hypothetical protein n=1 Tax=Streptomyces virginiae TaxID=1961 RepID=UPI0035D9AB90
MPDSGHLCKKASTTAATQVPRHSPDQQPEENRGPLLSAHAALVCVAAVVIGIVVGALTYLRTGNTAGAALAGLTAGGVSAVALHELIGR